jgi:carboxypeptidase Taq
MPHAPPATLESAIAHARKIALIDSTLSVLNWDERTGMPTDGIEHRAEQMQFLTGMVHQMRTQPWYGEALQEAEASDLAKDPSSEVGCNVRKLLRDYRRDVRLPQALVEALSYATTIGQQQWQQARAANDYKPFQPSLDRIWQLKREAADTIADGRSRYDALMDEYEEGATTATLAPLFQSLGDSLQQLIGELLESQSPPSGGVLERFYDVADQSSFCRAMCQTLGFDFQRGRLDVTSHPFCTSLGPNDIRILTRYDDHHFSMGFFGALHEAGHGLYEQGLPTAAFGLPAGTAVSLGVHESQSRLWENIIGRSQGFWNYAFPLAQKQFPAALSDVSQDTFYRAINRVERSLIRVEADEVTYNLHILIRFELEQALIDQQLSTSDLPGAWNDAYQRYLGVRPSNDREGVLQDIHWSAGLIGYFPTYTLGNLIAAQLWEAAQIAVDDLHEDVARGRFEGLLRWLRTHIHQYGRRYQPHELVERATGRPLDSTPLLHGLQRKYRRVYGLDPPGS